MKTSHAVAVICYALFFLFVYASTSKLIAFNYYLFDLKRSPLLQTYALPVAIAIPGVELVVAALLLTERTRKIGLAASVMLMMLFTGYVACILSFTNERPCSCGGIIRELTWPQHLVFNIGFLLLSILGYYLQQTYSDNKQHRTSRTNRLK